MIFTKMPFRHLLFLLFLWSLSLSLTFTLALAAAEAHPGRYSAAPRLTSKSSALELAARYAAAASLSASNASAALQLITAQCLWATLPANWAGPVTCWAGSVPNPVHKSELGDATTWACAALTDLKTCLQAARSMGTCTGAREKLVRSLDDASRHTSNALYFIARVKG